MTERDLKLENIRKKQSMKNKIAWYAMALMPISILGQIILVAFESAIRLPLEIIFGGCFTLLGLYFGANILQKNILKVKDNSIISSIDETIEGK